MRIESEQMWGYFEWLFTHYALLYGLLFVAALAVVGFLACYVVATILYGPVEGFYTVTRVIYELLSRDLPGTRWRRTHAIARLAFQEAIRRKVLAVIAVFIVGLLFGGWFLETNADYPARLYIEFVLAGTNWLVLLLGLFLSCFSLPADIRNKTIQTIVTKPVRSTEIVLGRVLGFTAIGTLLLAVMGVLSYGFVVRGVQHEHDIRELSSDGLGGLTSFDAMHAHTIEIGADGNGVTNETKGHRHLVTRISDSGPDGRPVYAIGPAEGMLEAKVPVLGSLRFTDREGKTGEGLNVGYESEYQKYIEGNSLMSAIWTFDKVSPERFGDELTFEMSLKAFRTFKGDIVTGVQGTITLANPDPRTKVESERFRFIVKEFAVDQISLPRKMQGSRDGVPTEIDLYRDLAPDGKLDVIIRCEDRGQYLGMAQADLFLREGESTFAWNMFKAYVGIWLQMLIIISFGVMFSTFLSGPVAMVATLTCLVFGYFGGLAAEVTTGKVPGGGPLETAIRMVTQTGATIELDLGNEVVEQVVQSVDYAIMAPLSNIGKVFPNFGTASYDTSEFVAYGVNIFGSLVLRHITLAAGYVLLTCLIGYFFLKTRELAA
jgi:ABC-type transport system involved in multi-copper enzyme maturation permease subunit